MFGRAVLPCYFPISRDYTSKTTAGGMRAGFHSTKVSGGMECLRPGSGLRTDLFLAANRIPPRRPERLAVKMSFDERG